MRIPTFLNHDSPYSNLFLSSCFGLSCGAQVLHVVFNLLSQIENTITDASKGRGTVARMRVNNAGLTKFSASTVHLEHITTALSCLVPFGSKEDVLIYIDKDGLSFVRENNHVIRIQLFLSRELFMSYLYQEGDGVEEDEEDFMRLCVKISHILDSVSVANRNSDDIVECTLSYDGQGTPLVLIFEDSVICERVEYSTYLIKDMDNKGLELDREQIIFECIIKGDMLYTALKDLKEIGCKECYLYARIDQDGTDNILALISKSQLGFSKIRLPSSKSILEKICVYDGSGSPTLKYNTPVIGFFDFNSLDKVRMSTKIASKVLMRMDAHGLLSVNMLSQTDDVIISDTRNNTTTDFSTSGSRYLQLPKDYPGIVIEVCMLEKESIDQIAQEEIDLLMTEIGRTSTKKIRSAKRLIMPPEAENNLLGLDNKRTKLQNQEEQTNADEETSQTRYPKSTADLPLFF